MKWIFDILGKLGRLRKKKKVEKDFSMLKKPCYTKKSLVKLYRQLSKRKLCYGHIIVKIENYGFHPNQKLSL